MEQPLWPTVLQVLSALAAPVVAIFTWKLARYTRELVKAQKASNRVLERQAELMDRQTELLEAQQRLQEQLAEIEVKPWLVIGKRSTSGANSYELYLSNAGLAGAVVTKIVKHAGKPERPQSGAGKPLSILSLSLPLALQPKETQPLLRGTASEVEEAAGGGWLEVRYRANAPGFPLLSDLWRLDGGRFVPEWVGEEVKEG